MNSTTEQLIHESLPTKPKISEQISWYIYIYTYIHLYRCQRHSIFNLSAQARKTRPADAKTMVNLGKQFPRWIGHVPMWIILVGDPYKPSFATVTGWGVDKVNNICLLLNDSWQWILVIHMSKQIMLAKPLLGVPHWLVGGWKWNNKE